LTTGEEWLDLVQAFLQSLQGALAAPAVQIIQNEDLRASFANDHFECAQQSAGATADQRARAGRNLARAVLLRQALALEFARVNAAVDAAAAEDALADTLAAATMDDAKAAAKKAQDSAAKALTQRQAALGDKVVAQYWQRADKASAAAQAEIDLRNSATSAICGADDHGRLRQWCGTYGLFAAALSYVSVRGPDGWTARNHLVSVAVPSVAFRFLPIPSVGWFALDLGLYSAFLTQSIAYQAPTNAKTACTPNPNDFENKLPCEANATVYPYLAGYFGASLGKSGVGFLTIAFPSVGLAQLGSDTTLRLYMGITVGALQLNGKF
jgi:hypothetical protein